VIIYTNFDEFNHNGSQDDKDNYPDNQDMNNRSNTNNIMVQDRINHREQNQDY